MCVEVRELVKENAILRDKLTKLKNYFVTTETEQQANRDKMIDMINEQSSITRLTDDMDIVVQVAFIELIIINTVLEMMQREKEAGCV